MRSKSRDFVDSDLSSASSLASSNYSGEEDNEYDYESESDEGE
jgi:hypothetical protein